MDAVLDEFLTEIDEESEADVCQSKVGQQLLLVDWSNAFDGFQLQQEPIFDDDVGLKTLVQPNLSPRRSARAICT